MQFYNNSFQFVGIGRQYSISSSLHYNVDLILRLSLETGRGIHQLKINTILAPCPSLILQPSNNRSIYLVMSSLNLQFPISVLFSNLFLIKSRSTSPLTFFKKILFNILPRNLLPEVPLL